MKNTRTLLMLLALGASAVIVNAQDAGGPPNGEHPPHQMGPGGGGPGMNGRRPPPSPVIECLDANHDGVIDTDEIENASAALKKLDKNGDGKLTQDEIRPPRPQGGDGQGRPPGPNGQRPQHPPTDN